MKIYWKKGLFSSNYELYSKNQKIGELKEQAFSKKAIGTLNDNKVKFTKTRFFCTEMQITDLNLNKNLGWIKFNVWGNKAEIHLNRKKLRWKYDSIWCNKWSVLENGQPIAKYRSSPLGGVIDSPITNEILLLSGLFIFNNYTQMTFFIVFFSVIIVSAN